MLGTYTKTPNDVTPYDVRFHRWLGEGDSLVSATATIEGSDTAVVDDVEVSLTVAKVWISGGADLDEATITVTAVTELGVTKEVCFRLRIRDCH